MDIKPERQVEIKLWDWLQTKGKDIDEVYFNSINPIDSKKTFNIKGIQTKADLIIKIRGFYGFEYLVVEVKTGDIAREVFDSEKIFTEYYLNYIREKTKYIINEQEIKVDYFIVATGYSFYGKLIKDDLQIKDNAQDKEDEWRRWCFENCLVPHYEFQRTNDFIRKLWATFRKYRNSKEYKTLNLKPALGVLLSSNLIEFSLEELKTHNGIIGTPLLFSMKFKNHKNKWQQEVRTI